MSPPAEGCGCSMLCSHGKVRQEPEDIANCSAGFASGHQASAHPVLLLELLFDAAYFSHPGTATSLHHDRAVTHAQSSSVQEVADLSFEGFPTGNSKVDELTVPRNLQLSHLLPFLTSSFQSLMEVFLNCKYWLILRGRGHPTQKWKGLSRALLWVQLF